ncbi:MAG: hypothetical protein ACRD0N_09935 [Acidimicrobiales bacterium]
MAKPEPAVERRTKRRHTALVLVSVVDRRILPALRFVSRLPHTDVRALHLCVDPAETRRLAEDWMELGLTWLPLHIHDAAAETLPRSLCEAVGREAARSGDMTVVIPELDFYRWWHPLLHRRSARRIAQQLQPVPGITTVIVPYLASPSRRWRRPPPT